MYLWTIKGVNQISCITINCFRNVYDSSVCVVAIKSRPVQNQCIVIVFWSTGFMNCMLFWFFKNSLAHTKVESKVLFL